ncbi:MAG TPA: TIR domain-containing protein [Steroidobacteraceae bacterium]|nr:TIR domain-containing protein [Steroidobacteraceae bacterium]
MADVFVSYARSDRARVAPIVAAIEAEGWTVWWDPDIAAGQEFDRRIADELKGASAVLVVWTPRSVESRWVRGEARHGVERGILVPVRFDAAELPIDVRALHTTDLDDWHGDPAAPQAREVLRALRATIERQRALQTAATSGRAALAASAAVGRPDRIPICVLPFANMSGDPEQEYFSDGITEDIITDLSKVSALSVISRNSAFVYKGRHVDLPKVARELNATHILEGSVRKAGGRVRITAQLVEAATNDHLWAERFDRDLHDIFELQDEISGAIVKALRLRLLPEEKRAIEQRGTDDVDAYNLYLMARQLYLTGNEGDSRRADAVVRLCTRATELDPAYARAWALRALGEQLGRFAAGTGSDGGLASAERALALDADLAEAHAVKATILAGEGRHDAAALEIAQALRLDPESSEVNRAAGYLSYRQHRFGVAIGHWEKAAAVNETDINSLGMLLSCYRAVGDVEALHRTARRTLDRTEKVLAHDPSNGTVLGYSVYAWAALGEAERAKERMNRALLVDPDNLNMRYNFGCVLVIHLPDHEAALDMLEPFFEKVAEGFFEHARVDPDFEAIRDLPRFKAMVAKAEERLARARSAT